jgi:hypothetical protein
MFLFVFLFVLLGTAAAACVDSAADVYDLPDGTLFFEINAPEGVQLSVTTLIDHSQPGISVSVSGSGRDGLAERTRVTDESGNYTLSFTASSPDCHGEPNGAGEVLACGCDDADSCNDCHGVPNGNGEDLACGCDDADSCNDCHGVPNGAGEDLACGCDDAESCLDCNGVPNGAGEDLACGCDDDESCRGCDGIPNSGLTLDACDVCGGDGHGCAGCDGIPNSGLLNDECGVCDGNGSTCADCHGVPNGAGEDLACGCDDAESCLDCNGVPNGAGEDLACGCDDAESCLDCNGVPNGAGEDLACGCDDAESCLDCAGVPNGEALDLPCGCNDATSCLDCLGIVNGSAVDLGCGCDVICETPTEAPPSGSSVSGNGPSSVRTTENFFSAASLLDTMLFGPLALFWGAYAACDTDGYQDVVDVEVTLPWGYELLSSNEGKYVYYYNPTFFGFGCSVVVQGESQATWTSYDVDELTSSLETFYNVEGLTLTFTITNAYTAEGGLGYVLDVFVNGFQTEDQAVRANDYFDAAEEILLGYLGEVEITAQGEIGVACAPGYIKMPSGACVATNDCIDETTCLTCTGYKNAGFENGWYDIYIEHPVDGWYWLNVYCSVTPLDTVGSASTRDGAIIMDDVAYTFYPIRSGGTLSYKAYGYDSCTDIGLAMWVPRTKDHWKRAYQFALNEGLGNGAVASNSQIREQLHPYAIVRTESGCGGCTTEVMNYDTQDPLGVRSNTVRTSFGAPYMDEPPGKWQAWDGGRWFIRDTTFNEPNGDYNRGCWLGLNAINEACDNQVFNDLPCTETSGYNSGAIYTCSTNDVYGPGNTRYPQFSDPVRNAEYWGE